MTGKISIEDLPVRRFCRQVLQNEQTPDFPPSDLLREDQVQEAIYTQVFSAETTVYPPPPSYKLKVLKSLLWRIEDSILDWEKHVRRIPVPTFPVHDNDLGLMNCKGVSENLSSALADLLSSPIPLASSVVAEKSYITYHLSLLYLPSYLEPHITLLENRSFISGSGTTGLRTWEASLHLGQYLCANSALIHGRRVLELGAGTGYLSILCARYLKASHVIASDGSDDVMFNLPDSFFLNGLQDSSSIQTMNLKWGHALVGTEEVSWNDGRGIDVVLGADITYDKRIIPALVGTLVELVQLCSNLEVLIAATERNSETLEFFFVACEKASFMVERLVFPVPKKSEQMGPFYDDIVPIHICKLVRAKNLA